tara:strand:- start:180 stop:344 length:165 start_codon:yes stop_codon:yes gene_type:complete
MDIYKKNKLKVLKNYFKYENLLLFDNNYNNLDEIKEILKKEYNYSDKQIKRLEK